jgi:hypothetical protein
MKTIKLLFPLLVLTGMNAATVSWKTLKPLKAYSADSYRLKETVSYLELREYYGGTETKGYVNNKYKVTVMLGGMALNSFGANIVKKFKAAKPNLSSQTDIKKNGICIMSGCYGHISNGFMIDTKGKIWRMNTVEDVIGMLGKIDTPSEIKLVLWLRHPNWDMEDKNHKEKYRKTSTGYTVLAEYDNSIMNKGECGHFTYKIELSQNGKIKSEKLLKKEPSKDGCLAMD